MVNLWLLLFNPSTSERSSANWPSLLSNKQRCSCWKGSRHDNMLTSISLLKTWKNFRALVKRALLVLLSAMGKKHVISDCSEMNLNTSSVSRVDVRSVGIDNLSSLSVFIFFAGGISFSDSEDSVKSESDVDMSEASSAGIESFVVFEPFSSYRGRPSRAGLSVFEDDWASAIGSGVLQFADLGLGALGASRDSSAGTDALIVFKPFSSLRERHPMISEIPTVTCTQLSVANRDRGCRVRIGWPQCTWNWEGKW